MLIRIFGTLVFWYLRNLFVLVLKQTLSGKGFVVYKSILVLEYTLFVLVLNQVLMLSRKVLVKHESTLKYMKHV